MSESASVLEEAEAALRRGETPVLATVVAVRGSSYRRPGARMLVSGGRWRAGSISGGCLEADVVRRADWLAAQSSWALRTYDTSADGDVALGCGGEVDVVLEALPEGHATLAALRTVVHARQATVVKVGDAEQRLAPSPRLLIIGGGYDVAPLVQQARTLGWDVHVIDWRSSTRTDATFHLRAPQQLDDVPFEAGCAVVVMSHHLLYDEAALGAALRSPLPGYIGVLGPRRRTEDLLARLPSVSRERLHAPVGLHLGGDGAPAVALSIAAELQQYFSASAPSPAGEGGGEGQTALPSLNATRPGG